MVKIAREIKTQLETRIGKGKIIILYGARQVGKTTLVQEIVQNQNLSAAYFNCDEPDVRQAFANKTSSELLAFIGSKKIVVIDEAQRVKNIGITLKLLADTTPHLQVIATGSSSFELSNQIIEPLTGRSDEFYLYPLSIGELRAQSGDVPLRRTVERRLVYGMYPEVVTLEGMEGEQRIRQIAKNYLYKDIFTFQHIRHSEALEKLVQALALQLGNEVSYTELSQIIGVDKNTVQQYIQILEQAFVIFRLPPFSRNVRNELKRLRKIYFYDNGIRNAIINNFNPLSLRTDVGALWENFMISERVKWNRYSQRNANLFFWRTHSQQEIDLIEEFGGQISAFEYKWKKQSYTPPPSFTAAYPAAQVVCVQRENFLDFF